MRGVILLGELIAVGGAASYLLHLLTKFKPQSKNKLRAHFIGGPWDGEERMLRKYTPKIVYVEDGELVAYEHTSHGIYEYTER